MALRLYHAVPSANSERVKIALHEKGLAYEGVELKLARRDQKRPEFLRLNPWGRVPVLEHEGRVIFESVVINEYLDERYPDPPLMPSAPGLRATARVIVDYALNFLHEPYWSLRGEMRKQEAERDAALVQERRRWLGGHLQFLEDALGEQPYFVGEFSLADIDLWPRVSRLELYGVLPDARFPRLAGWLARMKERPSVRALPRSE